MSMPAPHSPQISPENFRELEAARYALRKIRRAAGAARFEGYSIAIFGGLTILMGITSVTDILIGLVLTAVGVIEIVAGGRLRRLDVGAIRILTFNQLSFAVLIFLYASVMLHGEMVHPLSDVGDADAQLLGQAGPAALSMTHEIMMLVYASLIVAALFEAGMAGYFYSRGAHLDQYLAQTPEWIVSMQKAGVST
jgi:hypothetical protein